MRHGAAALAALALAASGGCQPGLVIRPDSPEMGAYLKLVLPARIEIQRYLTRPVRFDGSKSANGLEVLLAAYDSLGDLTRMVGTVNVELYTLRVASGDRLGNRVALWPIAMNSEETMQMYWDRLSRFYRFPLQLEKNTLPAGRYILTVSLNLPTSRRLIDEYEFAYDGTSAPEVDR